MFYRFYIREDHQIYLLSFWHVDNDLSEEIREYRMCFLFCFW